MNWLITFPILRVCWMEAEHSSGHPQLSQAAWHLDKALGFRVQAQPYYLLSAPLPPLPYQNADGKALPTLWLALLRGGVLFSSLIFRVTSMLYSDKWIAIVDISLLNSYSDWKLWHVRDHIDMCLDLIVLYPGPHMKLNWLKYDTGYPSNKKGKGWFSATARSTCMQRTC